jgi:hypothetical protein
MYAQNTIQPIAAMVRDSATVWNMNGLRLEGIVAATGALPLVSVIFNILPHLRLLPT